MHLVTWVDSLDTPNPIRVWDCPTRTYSWRPSPSIRFRALAAIATTIGCR
jgi:hypothetical protein